MARQALDILGFSVAHIRSSDVDAAGGGLQVLVRGVPLVVVACACRGSGTASMAKLLAALEGTYTVVVADEETAAEASQSGCVKTTVRLPCTGAGACGLAGNLVEALVRAREELLRVPEQYLPRAKRTPEAVEPYRGLRISKKACVFPSGQGVVDLEYSIQVTGRQFEGIAHYIGLTNEAPEDAILPPLRELLNRPIYDRFVGQRLALKQILPDAQLSQMQLVEVAGESTTRNRVFRLLFTPRPHLGQVLQYSMSWSHPQLFATGGEDSSVLKCLHDYDEIDLSLVFSSPSSRTGLFAADGEPVLHIYNCLDMETGCLNARHRETPEGSQYSWSLGSMHSHTTLVTKWKLRQEDPDGALM
jgi:hypothetical protein